MPNLIKKRFLNDLHDRYGSLTKVNEGQSLYGINNDSTYVYIRYSKIHNGSRAFFGLRKQDLLQLQSKPAYIVFLWNDQREPLFIPYSEYEEIFALLAPSGDEQYKVQIYLQFGTVELYIARAGRFNVENHIGWENFNNSLEAKQGLVIPQLSHSQVQTLLGSIGYQKDYDVWVPQNDRSKLDWDISENFLCCESLPKTFENIASVLQEVDVIWINKGSAKLDACFEVEHSTPVYSALLRFNDIHLTSPDPIPRFNVVANESRRSLFTRQLNRPTFRRSGLIERCMFLDYADVFGWYTRLRRLTKNGKF